MEVPVSHRSRMIRRTSRAAPTRNYRKTPEPRRPKSRERLLDELLATKAGTKEAAVALAALIEAK